jgi:hypothetical protein
MCQIGLVRENVNSQLITRERMSPQSKWVSEISISNEMTVNWNLKEEKQSFAERDFQEVVESAKSLSLERALLSWWFGNHVAMAIKNVAQVGRHLCTWTIRGCHEWCGSYSMCMERNGSKPENNLIQFTCDKGYSEWQFCCQADIDTRD